ncbi:MAG: HD domain-containing protein [Bacilli bacterium]
MENKEYLQIVEKLLENRKFGKLKNETHHHNSNRFNHSVEVSYKTYKICKKLGLDYESATKAALLHDFFFDAEFDNKRQRLIKHPMVALENASKITNLSKKEQNIIVSHMYPIGGKMPRCLESLVVDVVDDYVSLKEKLGGDFKSLKTAVNFLFILTISVLIK